MKRASDFTGDVILSRPTPIPLEERLFALYADLFPNFVWTDCDSALELMASGVRAGRAERKTLYPYRR